MKRKMAAALAAVSMALGASGSSVPKMEKRTFDEESAKELFTASLEPAPRHCARVTIAIGDYSTETDMRNLAAAYRSGGDGVLALSLNKFMGYAVVPGSQPLGLELIWSVRNGSSRIVTMIGEAPPLWFESWTVGAWGSEPANRAYPYSMIQLKLDAHGDGSGVLYQFVKLTFDNQGRPHVIPMKRFPIKLVDVYLGKK